MDKEKALKFLFDTDLINKDTYESLKQTLSKEEDPIYYLLEKNKIDDKKLFDTLKEKFNSILQIKEDISDIKINFDYIKSFFKEDFNLKEFIAKYKIIPFKKENDILHILLLNPFLTSIENNLKYQSGTTRIIRYLTTYENLNKLIEGIIYGDLNIEAEANDVELIEERLEIDASSLSEKSEESPIVKAANFFIADAVSKGASDIHIEPREKNVIVRYRIDGLLHIIKELPKSYQDPLIARYKIMANMDISERRKPQDGRIRLKINNEKIDLRVSTVPTIHGEKMVMRIQVAEKYLTVKLEDLGFEADDLIKFRRAINMPYGMILVTGPTGSGKTTTLYSSLQERNKEDVNIMTAEDPVEVAIPGLNQVEISERAGRTFASVLRAFLRQDPDIILVGEIRDFETADIAIKAALTGHLVFATLHTNDAPSTISRLLDMNVEPVLISSSVLLISAQRLVRKLCPKCKEKDERSFNILKEANYIKEGERVDIYRAKEGGCDYCNNTGYKGRTLVTEIMEIDDDIRKEIVKRSDVTIIREKAIEKGMNPLYKTGIIKVKKGITSLEELNRVVLQD